jgi:hypothetical protein
MLFAFAAMMGWCGTKWPGWWRWPHPPIPDPEPWWRLIDGLLGVAGGIAAVVVFEPLLRDQGLMLTGGAAFFGGLAAATLVESIAGLSAKGR